jgi:hypothetical protein
MKYFYTIIFTTTLVVLQLVGAGPTEDSTETPHESGGVGSYRAPARKAVVLSPADPGPYEVRNAEGSEKPYGLHYNTDENSWTLYATVLQLKNTSVYGRPGEIAQIEYSLDGERSRYAWIVVKIDDYSFSDDTGAATAIDSGQSIQLYVSGAYVSSNGVDWEKCPKNDTYCMNAGFIEGGFPQSEDYDGLTLCPSNTIIRSGFASDDWINGMLAWKIRVIPNF